MNDQNDNDERPVGDDTNGEARDGDEREADDFEEDSAESADSADSADPADQRAAGAERGRDGARGRRAGSRERDEETIEPKDDRTKRALEFVSDVVREMELDCRVLLRNPREGDSEDEINIEIIGRDAGLVIGKKGQVLQALQSLTHRVVNRPGLDRRHVVVDAEGYRSRRDDSLANMAKQLGKQAVTQGKIITFEPMNPRDRRVVHLALAKFEGVITKSEGEGDERRVQIIPVRRPTAADSGPGAS
jgi:spoIIIJ-associated protein